MPTRTPTKPTLDVSGLLTAEFEYIAQTMVEAHEDRARVSSFYLVAVGSFVAALFGTQFFNNGELPPTLTMLLFLLFLLLTLLGTSTIIQLGRLRVAWNESAKAMNQIKDFAKKYYPELKDAFRWKTTSIPDKYKKGSISHIQALEVSCLSGLMMGTSIYFLIVTFDLPWAFLSWLTAGILGILSIFVELEVYKRSLE